MQNWQIDNKIKRHREAIIKLEKKQELIKKQIQKRLSYIGLLMGKKYS